MKTTHKITLPLFALGILLILAGCASHNDPSAVGAAPGVTPPAAIPPPPPPKPFSSAALAARRPPAAAQAGH